MPEPTPVYDARTFGPDIFCPTCSYNLFGTTSDKCSECGHDLTRLRDPESRIPWVRDRHRDRYLAYWKTVFLVTFRPRRFAEAYAGTLQLRDARKFQIVTVLHAYLPLLATMLFAYATTPLQPDAATLQKQIATFGLFQPPLADSAYAAIWPALIWHSACVLFLLACTGIPNYFYHPRSVSPQQQENGIAMSTYACAPLAFYPVLVMTLTVVAVVAAPSSWVLSEALVNTVEPTAGLGATAAICVVAWWIGLLGLVRRLMPRHKHRHVALGLGMPILWLTLAALFLVLLPLFILYVVVVVASLVS